ncbi:hypothetical protein FB451DRAFT_1264493 [Mycena latifolia]|nr:hypothetical protein FB451DRAFT_1264493 [Mycena latifolia]
MAAPFFYIVPKASPSLPHNPYHATSQGGPSPFLPPSAILYSSSPYLGATGSGSIPGTPENFNANSVLWPENWPQYDESAYTASLAPLSNRPRTTSWHGPAPRPASPFLQPAAPLAFVHSQYAYIKPGKRRSASWGNASAPPPPSRRCRSIQWLNGDAPSPVSTNPRSIPPLTALRIFHPRIPSWPIDFALREELAGAVPPPISLADVLVALHRELHNRISQADWATLRAEDEQAVTKAFLRRCRAEAVRSGVPPAHIRDQEVTERNEGVKCVDFLLGKTVFKGLVRLPGDPEGCVCMVTA